MKPRQPRLARERSFATPRFLEALSFATSLHDGDVRKGTSVPYVAHLLSVCSLVLVDGGNEDEAVAALLHDSLEDHPETVTRDDLRLRFGIEVLEIVEACTETPPDYRGGPKPPWRERKLAYLEHLRHPRAKGRRVALADKLDNVRSALADYRTLGDPFFARFNAGKEDQLWFYRELVDAFRAAGPGGLLFDEFARAVAELDRLARRSTGSGQSRSSRRRTRS